MVRSPLVCVCALTDMAFKRPIARATRRGELDGNFIPTVRENVLLQAVHDIHAAGHIELTIRAPWDATPDSSTNPSRV